MNIFDALSARKDNKLREVNLSALLAYFLNPANDHGIGNTFLAAFLDLVEEEIKKNNKKNIELFDEADLDQTTVESEYKPKKSETSDKKFSFDVLVQLHGAKAKNGAKSKNAKGKKLHRIVIENKVKKESGQTWQLKDYYDATRKETPRKQIIMVFLTPSGADKLLEPEFEKLQNMGNRHYKAWVYWNERNSVQSIIRQKILERESRGEIAPINEHSRHTLKALAMHLEGYSLKGRTDDSRIRKSADQYPIDDTYPVKTLDYEVVVANNRTYAYVRKLKSKERVGTIVALREINDKLKLGVKTSSKTRDGSPRALTSHELGLMVAAALERERTREKTDDN